MSRKRWRKSREKPRKHSFPLFSPCFACRHERRTEAMYYGTSGGIAAEDCREDGCVGKVRSENLEILKKLKKNFFF